jgi:hypothetical protein
MPIGVSGVFPLSWKIDRIALFDRHASWPVTNDNLKEPDKNWFEKLKQCMKGMLTTVFQSC